MELSQVLARQNQAHQRQVIVPLNRAQVHLNRAQVAQIIQVRVALLVVTKSKRTKKS